MDTKGPEIRTGFFEDGLTKLTLTKGDTLILTTDYSFKGNHKKLACSYPELARTVQTGQQILAADGSLVLTVLALDPAAGEISCRVENNASIGERKNMNLPGVVVSLPTFTEKDVDGTLCLKSLALVVFVEFVFVWIVCSNRRSLRFIDTLPRHCQLRNKK